MTSRTPVDFSKPPLEIARALAEGSSSAYDILRELVILHQGNPVNLLFDFYDMNIRGIQIPTAFSACAFDLKVLAKVIANRDEELVQAVNKVHEREGLIARINGEQTRINPVDVAVAASTTQSRIVDRADEGAEHVHHFFLKLLQQMQKEGRFTTNMRVNLGLESGHCMVFVIAAAELLDKEGKPVDMQPTKEGDRQAALNPLQPHQQRVVEEKAQLDTRLKRLVAFYDTDIFAALDQEERCRLQRQGQVMSEYAQILEERIAAFTPKESVTP